MPPTSDSLSVISTCKGGMMALSTPQRIGGRKQTATPLSAGGRSHYCWQCENAQMPSRVTNSRIDVIIPEQAWCDCWRLSSDLIISCRSTFWGTSWARRPRPDWRRRLESTSCCCRTKTCCSTSPCWLNRFRSWRPRCPGLTPVSEEDWSVCVTGLPSWIHFL